MTKALMHITRPAFEHIDNNHEGLSKEQAKDLMSINDDVESIYRHINQMLRDGDFSEIEMVLTLRDQLFESIAEAIKSELSRINEARSNTKASMLYLTILTETKNMVLQSRNLLKSQQYFLKLYGFSSQAELNSFKMLIGVSGVGPKAALAVLSSTSPQNLALSIVTGDEKALTAAPGIGKKIAQRIILELKDKLAKDQSSFSAQSSGAIPVVLPGDKGGEAAAALAVLGYGSQEIGLALKGIDMDALPLEEIIRQSLKKMVK